MATTKVGVTTVGAAWAVALGLWVDFANGVYTSWSYAVSILNSGYDIEVTVGLSGGGTDVHKIQPLDTNWNDHLSLNYVFASPGWRAMPQVLLPLTVPGGTAIDTAFTNGPWALRNSILVTWCNASSSQNTNDQHACPEGAQTTVWRRVWKHSNLLYVDVIGIMWGTLTGLDSVTGQPTDYIGSSPAITMVSGGGGTVDLTPLVTAVNEIANKDMLININDGEAVLEAWSAVEI